MAVKTAGKPSLAGKVVGAYYTTFIPSGSVWALAAGDAVGTMMCFPAYLAAGTLDALAQQSAGTPTAGELLRLGIYNDNGGKPGSLLEPGGTIDLSLAIGLKTVTIAQTIATAGLYWLASVRQGPSAITTLVCAAFGNRAGGLISPNTAPAPTNLYGQGPAAMQTGVTGALPASYTGTTWGPANGANSAPAFFRYSA